MLPKSLTARPPDSQRAIVTTTCFIANLHCLSCVEAVRDSLSALQPAPESTAVSIVAHSVIVRHIPLLLAADILSSLEATGFEVHSIFQDNKAIYEAPHNNASDEKGRDWASSMERAVSQWTSPKPFGVCEEDKRKKTVHLEQCEQCRAEQGGICLYSEQDLTQDHKALPTVAMPSRLSQDGVLSLPSKSLNRHSLVNTESIESPSAYKVTLSLSGMTCSSCVSSITCALERLAPVRTTNINLLTSSGVVTFVGMRNIDEIVSAIEGCGFDVSVEAVEEVNTTASKYYPLSTQTSDDWRAIFTLGGMTCSSCVGHVTNALETYSWVKEVDVSLITSSATIVFQGKERLASISDSIDNAGYTATLESVNAVETEAELGVKRSVSIRIEGMFCDHCPQKIIQCVEEKFEGKYTVEFKGAPLSLASPFLRIEYIPDPPDFSIQQIFRTILDANTAFCPSIFYPPTIEERAKAMHAEERRRTLRHLVVCIIVAIPTFVLGIVLMSLVPSDSHAHRYIMERMWAGNTTRLAWALFILAIPVYFYSAKSFHVRAFKELKVLWRPGSHAPIWHRFVRFGSMNMLMSLGTTIAFLASIVELALAATKKSSGSMDNSYFDAVVFLTMFLLLGRFLEALSKAKTGDAVTSLGALRSSEAVLIDSTAGDTKISTDLLEIGDIVRVHNGASPPFDGIILGGSSTFDESNLTGESRPVKKQPGDYIYSGTVNKAAPVQMKITTISGTSMLDQIINAVREGQTHRAPVERVADTITAHFVPFVILVAILTWTVWLVLGTTNTIPKDWRDEEAGGWALWSLRFSIAVFVVACPCGIGLATPTALFVGGGLAAKHGILVRGGGEAFQEASTLDCIVFDKTGTLTNGGDPKVTEYAHQQQDLLLVLGIVKALEKNSGHPIAQALVSFCCKEVVKTPTTIAVNEIPGKGLKGSLDVDGHTVTAIIGNEAHMADHAVPIPPDRTATLNSWKARGESVALVAILSASTQNTWVLASMFSISDPLRPEAIGVVCALKKRGIDVWMLSGDNIVTANAVGAQVGIPASNIIAGVLPHEKAKKIALLQQTLVKPQKSRLFWLPSSFGRSKTAKRATVAMVGDGINDAPALSTADLGIAIGSGSDIALSSSSFILVNSNLTTILVLLDLSRVVFRRVYLNFGWATVYNLIAMPIAAGVLYPITQNNGKHVRLDPVWASLAMALSSLSVVCSSLALRSRIPWVGFRARKREEYLNEEVASDDVSQFV